MKKNITKTDKGFTLVELLVVIAIIAILSIIGLTLFNGAQSNARDARRRSDIDAIAAALEAKRQPGTVIYSPISVTDFSSGSIPTDTYTTQRYCIKLWNGTSDTGDSAKATAITGMASAWTFGGVGDGTGSGSNVCPTGFWSVNGALFTGSATTTAQFTTATVKSWVVCAELENTTATATPSTWSTGVYCKLSAQ